MYVAYVLPISPRLTISHIEFTATCCSQDCGYILVVTDRVVVTFTHSAGAAAAAAAAAVLMMLAAEATIILPGDWLF